MLTTKNVSGLVKSQPTKEQTMRVKFIRNTVANGQAVNEGETHDVPEREAQMLIAMKRAVAVEAAPAPAEIEMADARSESIETADVKRPRKK
jgi:hypothetical protein